MSLLSDCAPTDRSKSTNVNLGLAAMLLAVYSAASVMFLGGKCEVISKVHDRCECADCALYGLRLLGTSCVSATAPLEDRVSMQPVPLG